MGDFWVSIVGVVAALIARAVLPITQTLGILLTATLGALGALIADFSGRTFRWYVEGQSAALLAAAIGAVVLLFIVGKFKSFSK